MTTAAEREERVLAEVERLVAENARLWAVVDAVEKLHFVEPHGGGVEWCHQDGIAWPCPTIAALRSEGRA